MVQKLLGASVAGYDLATHFIMPCEPRELALELEWEFALARIS